LGPLIGASDDTMTQLLFFSSFFLSKNLIRFLPINLINQNKS